MGQRPLQRVEIAEPRPGPGQVTVRVSACGICRTDLHVVEGELPVRREKITPGHQVVGRVSALGAGVTGVAAGDRVGVAWLHSSDGTCEYCRSGRENLCEHAEFTGWTMPGGYADALLANAAFVYPIPREYQDVEAAPLLCAGIIGYRCLRLAGLGEG
ncbi:MAG: alcohol dehydrogenase catalytic domain-containing protein, partial [Terriglobales bacterium]